MMIRTFKSFICGNKLYVKRLMAIRCEMKNLRSYLHFVGGDYHTSVLELLESPDKVFNVPLRTSSFRWSMTS